MSRTGHFKDSYDADKKKEASVLRSIERLQGKLALAATFEQVARECPDKVTPGFIQSMKELRYRIDSYRAQLKIKNGLFEKLSR